MAYLTSKEYILQRNRDRKGYADRYSNKKTEVWHEETSSAAKKANLAKYAKELAEKRLKALKSAESDPNDVKLATREALREAVVKRTTVPNPNVAFRAQKGRRSVFDYQADVKRVVERLSPKAHVYHSKDDLYHNPGPGKVWDPVAEEWKEMGGGVDLGVKEEGNTPWPEDQEEDPLSEDDSLWDIDEGDIPR
jgi:hypothetical protein